MNKRKISILILLLFFIFLIYFLLATYIKKSLDVHKKIVETNLPNFKYRLLNNSEFTENDIGKKDVIFYFFSPDCGECNKMSKKVCELVALFPEFQFLMVSNESIEVVNKYYNSLSCKSIKVLIDEQNSSTDKFSIKSIPTVLIYKKGVLKERIIGNVKLSFIKEKIAN